MVTKKICESLSFQSFLCSKHLFVFNEGYFLFKEFSKIFKDFCGKFKDFSRISHNFSIFKDFSRPVQTMLSNAVILVVLLPALHCLWICLGRLGKYTSTKLFTKVLGVMVPVCCRSNGCHGYHPYSLTTP